MFLGENESHEVRPGAVHVRGTSYRSGLSSPSYNEERNNEIMPPVVEQRVMASREDALASGESMVSAYAVDDPSPVQEAKVINVKRQRILLVLLVSMIIIIMVAVIVPVVIKTRTGNQGDISTITFSSIIVNLCSPRHMKVHNNKLYVPEAGVGPLQIAGDRETTPLCLSSSLAASPGSICFGNTGQVNAYNLDGTHSGDAPLKSLFSVRPTAGGFTNQVYGASGVDFDEKGTMYTLVGLGYVNASELIMEAPELVFGSVLRGDQPVASPWFKVFERAYGPEVRVESNPFHLYIHDGITYIVDAGANLLYTYLDVDTAGTEEPDFVVVLPKIDNVPAVVPNPRGGPCTDVVPPDGPSYCGQYKDTQGNWLYSADPVPTAVRVNPKEPNRLYVAYLGGAIWNEPVSGIFYMDLVDGIPQNDTLKAITGHLWAVIDFDFYEDSIFVLETIPGGFLPFGGRLSQIVVDSDGSILKRTIITEDLYQPVSMIVHGDTIFVSNNTFNSGIDDCNGQILSAKLR